ncbi:hypothetical protein CIK89_01165 [Prevotella sp. P4-119]|nr:hypothetical protein CIK89_01165 [Prevotella sp. P4-119]
MHRKESGSPCGSITKKGTTYFHPNLATDGSDTGCNFLSQEIFEYAKWRIEQKKAYETINEDRLFNNFLSSQPMAFNLFVPLMNIAHTDEGRSKLAKVVAGQVTNSDSSTFNKITEVGIEFIPPYYSGCLNDKTAMDAYFLYERTDGKHGIIAIETKYTDILGTNPASNPSFAIRQATENIGISQLLTDEGIAGITKRDIKLSQVYRTSNPQPIGFSGILLAKRQNSFYCTYFLHNRNVADTKSPYPIKRLEVIRWFNQKSMVFNQSLS